MMINRFAWAHVAVVCVLLNSGIVAGKDLGTSRINLIDGTTLNASITEIDSQGNISGQGITDGLNLLHILSIETDRKPRPATSPVATIYPVGGGNFSVNSLNVTDEKTEFQSGVGANELPLQAVRAFVWSSSPAVENAIKEPSPENDKVIVETADGDRMVEGILESIDDEFVHVNFRGTSRKIALAKIRAVVTADLGLKNPSGASATVDCLDGSQLVGVVSSMTNDQLRLNVAGGATIGVSTNLIVRVSIESDRLLFLSDTQPVEVQEKSQFTIERSWKRDRSVENNPLKIRSGNSGEIIEFKKGIGTKSLSMLVFANTKQFDRFNATVGIDAETEGRGDCQMVVQGDGIELWTRRVKSSDGPVDVDVDITGMKTVSLIVYPGEQFDLGDHADWANARFLKTR